MPLLSPLQSIIEEQSELIAESLLKQAVVQNPALLNEVDEMGNNLLMNAILLKNSALALSILKLMDAIELDNRAHRNHANKNALLLVIENELSTVALELVTFRGSFSLEMLDNTENARKLGFLLFSNISPVSSNPEFRIDEFKLFSVLLVSNMAGQVISPKASQKMKERYFTAAFQLLITLYPHVQINTVNFNSKNRVRLGEIIKTPLSFYVIEEVVEAYKKQELPNSITLEQKITLTLCAAVYDDKNLIDYIVKLPCLDEIPSLKFYLNRMWLNPMREELPDPDLTLDVRTQKQFQEIRTLFCNPQLCMELFTNLNEKLGDYYKEKGIELPEVNTQNPIHTGLFFWPIPEKWTGPKTEGALSKFLLQKERKFGINAHPHAPGFFAGSVDQKAGNRFVQELNLFKEYKKASSPLHGMEIHRLQWFLIMRAAEEKLFSSISEEDIPQLLQVSINLYKNNISLWVYFFDAYPLSKAGIRDIGFACPEVLHSLVLFSNLHHLAACLFEKYTKNLEFLAKINGHNSSIRECVLFDFWRAKSFTLLRPEQSPLSYYSREELEFYHEKYPLNDNPPDDYQYIFYKKNQC